MVSLRHSNLAVHGKRCVGSVERRRALTAGSLCFPSKGEMLKSMNSVFPTPTPPPVSVWESRPSSAIRPNRIKGLRET